MKAKRIKVRPRAHRIFTDREEPIQKFWETYNCLRQNLGEESDVTVLTYYGIGGIGKTSLLKEIRKKLKERIPDAKHFYYDFATNVNIHSFLQEFRDHLFETYGYEFPLFDLTRFVYYKKIDKAPEKIRNRDIIPDSPFVNHMLDVAETMPIVGPAMSIIRFLGYIIDIAQEKLLDYKIELNELKNAEPDLILENLPLYFSIDLSECLMNSKEPLVIFLDTYEALVNELDPIGEPLTNDSWLRGEDDGLVRSIPNTMWVIAGRERLKWETIDKEAGWQNALSQQLLGDLSEADSCAFLTASGISDMNLQRSLYRLTSGTPFYLNLAVDNYHKLTQDNKTPTIDRIGRDKDRLISCYLRELDSNSVDLLYILSCLDDWTDDLLLSIIEKFLPGISPMRLQKFKDFSFVISGEAGRYSMHRTMKDALYSPLNNFKSDVNSHMARYYFSKILHMPPSDLSYGPFLHRFVKHILEGIEKENDFLYFHNKLFDMFEERLKEAFQYHELLPIVKTTVLFTVKKFGEGVATAYCYGDYASVLSAIGKYKGAIQYGEMAYTIFNKLFGEDNPTTLAVANNLANHYGRASQHEKAIELSKKTLAIYKRNLGEDHQDTLEVMNNLAADYAGAGQYEEAVELGERVLNGMIEVLGEEHPKTLIAFGNLALYYSDVGRYGEMIETGERMLSLAEKTLGNEHPVTLSAMNNLAACYKDVGRREEAIELGKKAFRLRKTLQGLEHPHTLEAMVNLTQFYCDIGRCGEGIELGEKALGLTQDFLGKDAVITLTAMRNLAMCYSRKGIYDKAVALGEEVIASRKRLQGDEHPETLKAMQNLAFYRMELEQSE